MKINQTLHALYYPFVTTKIDEFPGGYLHQYFPKGETYDRIRALSKPFDRHIRWGAPGVNYKLEQLGHPIAREPWGHQDDSFFTSMWRYQHLTEALTKINPKSDTEVVKEIFLGLIEQMKMLTNFIDYLPILNSSALGVSSKLNLLEADGSINLETRDGYKLTKQGVETGQEFTAIKPGGKTLGGFWSASSYQNGDIQRAVIVLKPEENSDMSKQVSLICERSEKDKTGVLRVVAPNFNFTIDDQNIVKHIGHVIYDDDDPMFKKAAAVSAAA